MLCFCFKQKTAYEMRISDWSSDVCSSDLAGLIDATRRAAGVIGIDSGPLHLAAALGKSGVAIYGPTDPARNGPFGKTIEVIRDSDAVTSYKRRKVRSEERRVGKECVRKCRYRCAADP